MKKFREMDDIIGDCLLWGSQVAQKEDVTGVVACRNMGALST